MRRFWTMVSVDADRGIRLDDRPVRTPGRVSLLLATDMLAQAVAEEWRAVGETIDPRTMPLTGLANAAIDRVAPDPAAFAAGLSRYGESDLVCYRADSPPALAARQAEAWDPLIAWARHRYDVHLEATAGVMHCPQPPETLRRLASAVAALGPFTLASLSPIVTVTGSLVIALGLMERAIDPDIAWAAAEVDEVWQAEKWGEDPLAVQARGARRYEFTAGARFLVLLDGDTRL